MNNNVVSIATSLAPQQNFPYWNKLKTKSSVAMVALLFVFSALGRPQRPQKKVARKKRLKGVWDEEGVRIGGGEKEKREKARREKG